MFTIVTAFTPDYLSRAQTLIASASVFGYPVLAVPYKPSGLAPPDDWRLNVYMKVEVLRKACIMLGTTDVIWVDADATIVSSLDGILEDVQQFGIHFIGDIMASGTMVLRPGDWRNRFLYEWYRLCLIKEPWGNQGVLHEAVKTLEDLCVHHLPRKYCQIFDMETEGEEPAILHHQASRTMRRRGA